MKNIIFCSVLFCSVLFCNINTFSKCCDGCETRQYKIILCGYHKNWSIVQLCFFHFDYNQNDLQRCAISVPYSHDKTYIEGEYAKSLENNLYGKTHEYDLPLNNCLCFRKKAKLQIDVYRPGDTDGIKKNLPNADAVIFVCSNAQTLDETKKFLGDSGIADADIPVLVEFLLFNDPNMEYKENTTYLNSTHFNVYTSLFVLNHKNNAIFFRNPKSQCVDASWDIRVQAEIMRTFINSL